MSERKFPAVLPAEAQCFLRGLDCDLIDEEDVPARWITQLADEYNTGPVRPQVERLPGLVLH